jgi:hypothetical protein
MYLDKDRQWFYAGAVGHWLAICLIRIDEKDTIMHLTVHERSLAGASEMASRLLYFYPDLYLRFT